MINDDNIEQNKFSGHGAGSCPAFPNRTPTTDLDHVAGCPRWSLLIIFDIIDSYLMMIMMMTPTKLPAVPGHPSY